MGYPTRLLPALLAGLWLGAPAPAPAQTTAQASLLAQALDAAATGDWTEAATLAAWTGSPVAKDILLWTRLRDGAGTWDEYSAFLGGHPDWPGLATLRRAGERQMPKALPPAAVIAFFAEPPQTGTGSLRLAEALRASAREEEADAEVVRAWTQFSLTSSERSALLEGWREVLKPHHEERLDMLLWRGLTSEAEAMMRLVGEDWQKLAQARIATRRDAEGMQYLDQHRPGAAEERPGPRFRAVPLPGGEGALAGRRGLHPREVDARRPRSAGRTCGWSAAPTWHARRSRTATSRAPTGSRRRTSAPRGRTMPMLSGWRGSSR